MILPLLISFSCDSRRDEMPLLAGGVASQYIHVPKTGGTTIQVSLHRHLVNNSFAKSQGVTWACRSIEAEAGVYYYGHAPIGWCSTLSAAVRPFYIVSVREPFSKMISLYDYYATYGSVCPHCTTTFNHEVAHIHSIEKEVHGDRRIVFERLLAANDTVAWEVANQTQFNYLIPLACAEQTLAHATHNLLKCDIVVTTENLKKQFMTQLLYHAPYMSDFKFVSTNKAKRPKQILSQDIRDRLSSVAQIDIDFYDIARQVADIRTRRALGEISSCAIDTLPESVAKSLLDPDEALSPVCTVP